MKPSAIRKRLGSPIRCATSNRWNPCLPRNFQTDLSGFGKTSLMAVIEQAQAIDHTNDDEVVLW